MSGIRDRYASLSKAQKVPKGVPAYTLWVNRRAGRWVAAAAPSWLTPNGITLLGAAFTYGALIGLWFVPVGAAWGTLIGVLLVIGFILDSADGQLSRLRGGGTPLGEWLDHVLDAGRIALLHISVAAYMIRVGWPLESLAWVAVFLVTATLVYAGGLLVDKVRSSGTTAPRSTVMTRSVAVRAFILLPVDYGVTCLVFLLVPLFDLFLWAYVVLAVLSVLLCVVYMAKWIRELSAVPAA